MNAIRRTLDFVRNGHPVLAARWLLTDAWWWLTDRFAVEVVRHRTRHGRHTETRADTRRLDDRWADELHDIAADLDPLPLYDEGIAIRERYRREAWAATGMTQAEYWASVAPHDPDCDRSLDAVLICRFCADQESARQASLEPTPNQAMNLWQANDVIPPRIAAILHRATSEDTAVEVDHATLEPYIVGLAGGDPFDGLGQDAWLDRLFAGAR